MRILEYRVTLEFIRKMTQFQVEVQPQKMAIVADRIFEQNEILTLKIYEFDSFLVGSYAHKNYGTSQYRVQGCCHSYKEGRPG